MNHSPLENSKLTVNQIQLPDLFNLWTTHRQEWHWRIPFVTPPWLSAWWQSFAEQHKSFLLQVNIDERPIGIAPLILQEKTATFMGSADLCDYFDFPAAPEYREVFCQTLLSYFKEYGVEKLKLGPVLPDSLIKQFLIPIAKRTGWQTTTKPVSSSLQMSLPTTWDTYLLSLSRKQRHEARRKLRKLNSSGSVQQRIFHQPTDIDKAMDIFLHLFCLSRPDKKSFMTDKRNFFFRCLAKELSQSDMLKLLHLTIDNHSAAAVFCIDYMKTTYLYNNGFAPQFRSISLGVASKLLTIQSAITTAQKSYDFLSGTERYKYQLGGKETELSNCLLCLESN